MNQLWNTITTWFGALKHWFINHYENPLIWIFLLLGILFIVMMGYNYLHKR